MIYELETSLAEVKQQQKNMYSKLRRSQVRISDIPATSERIKLSSDEHREVPPTDK